MTQSTELAESALTADGYPSGAIEHLRAGDPVLGDLITRYGIVTRDRGRPPFYALVAAIVGQQISVKAAAAIMGRLLGLFAEGQAVQAAALADVSFEQLRAVGLSAAKARYLHDLAEKVADRTVDLATLAQLSDEEVVAILCQVKDPNIVTVNQQAPFLKFVEACDQFCNGRLPGTRVTDQRQSLTGRDEQVEVRQDWFIIGIPEINVVEMDMAF